MSANGRALYQLLHRAAAALQAILDGDNPDAANLEADATLQAIKQHCARARMPVDGQRALDL